MRVTRSWPSSSTVWPSALLVWKFYFNKRSNTMSVIRFSTTAKDRTLCMQHREAPASIDKNYVLSAVSRKWKNILCIYMYSWNTVAEMRKLVWSFLWYATKIVTLRWFYSTTFKTEFWKDHECIENRLNNRKPRECVSEPMNYGVMQYSSWRHNKSI